MTPRAFGPPMLRLSPGTALRADLGAAVGLLAAGAMADSVVLAQIPGAPPEWGFLVTAALSGSVFGGHRADLVPADRHRLSPSVPPLTGAFDVPSRRL